MARKLSKQVLSYDVLDVPVSVTSLDHASASFHDWARDSIGRFVCVRDVHGVMWAHADAAFRNLHRDAAMVTPDGMPLVWLGRLAGLPVERTCGPDLMERVVADSVDSGLRHFFYGGKHGVAETLRARFEERFQGVSIVATETPPFDELDDAAIAAVAQRITLSGADVVWVGLSTPKQELLMARLAPLVSSTLVGVGAAFDFHSGAVRRAPRWMRSSGLEWLYRLLSEPRRLWYRYLILAPQFVWLVGWRALMGRVHK